MSELSSLSQIETVKNLKHQIILKAIRDTVLPVSKIAKKLNVKPSLVYYVIQRYLPPNTLLERNQRQQLINIEQSAQCLSSSTNEDKVIIVDPPSYQEVSNALPASGQLEQSSTKSEISASSNFSQNISLTNRQKTLYDIIINIMSYSGTTVLPTENEIKKVFNEKYNIIPSPRDIYIARKKIKIDNPNFTVYKRRYNLKESKPKSPCNLLTENSEYSDSKNHIYDQQLTSLSIEYCGLSIKYNGINFSNLEPIFKSLEYLKTIFGN